MGENIRDRYFDSLGYSHGYFDFKKPFPLGADRLNYLTHAYRFLHDPYFVAGVAMPDWLRVVGKQYRARRSKAWSLREECKDPHSPKSRFYSGVVQHHDDDAWFHQTESFVLLSAHLAVELRRLHGPEASVRSHFLGHIVIELLLDHCLAARNEDLIESYYQTLDELDSSLIEECASRLVGHSIPEVWTWIVRFKEERFLFDYGDDERLLFRLNQVMRRVGLPPLGDEVLPWLANARSLVERASGELLCQRDP